MHHRAVHWIFFSGAAEVTNGETEQLLQENQSTYIPTGSFSEKLDILEEHTFTTWIQSKSKEIRAREAIPMLRVA